MKERQKRRVAGIISGTGMRLSPVQVQPDIASKRLSTYGIPAPRVNGRAPITAAENQMIATAPRTMERRASPWGGCRRERALPRRVNATGTLAMGRSIPHSPVRGTMTRGMHVTMPRILKMTPISPARMERYSISPSV